MLVLAPLRHGAKDGEDHEEEHDDEDGVALGRVLGVEHVPVLVPVLLRGGARCERVVEAQVCGGERSI